MKNYRVDLENVTDLNIEIIKSYTCKTEKQARAKAIKLSTGKDFEKAKTHKNGGFARVWVWSDESANKDWEYGIHTMEYVDGKCTQDTVG